MSEKEELLFGLKRWMQKALKYSTDFESFDDFLDSELHFDAVCYCFEMVSEISNNLIKYQDVIDTYKSIDFDVLVNLKQNIYKGDNINLSAFEAYLEIIFPDFIKALIGGK